jgi:hypothetical protein
MRLAVRAFAALLIFHGSPALAVAPAEAKAARPADWSERVSQALILAQLTQPEDEVLSTALKQLDDSLVKTLAAQPDMHKLETEYPGFLKRYYAAARPEISKALSDRLPRLWQGMADAYAAEMTAAEIQDQMRFMRSPLGQKMHRLLNANFETGPLLESSVNANLTRESRPDSGAKELGAASSMAMLYSLSQLSDAERAEFVAYTSSPTGTAVQRAGPGVMAALLAWMNADDPEAETRMGKIAVEVFEQMQQERGGK